MLAACTLASGSMAFAAEATESPVSPTSEPKVELQMVAVAKDQTVEVGLNVTADNFKSIGAVLTYDAKQVKLVDWKAGEDVTVAQKEASADAWSTYSTVPTKGGDVAMAKPALAYQTGNTGYLYLGADAFNPTSLTESTRLVTVRFKYKGNEDEAKTAFEELTTQIKANQEPDATQEDTYTLFKVKLASASDASAMLTNGNVECTVEETADVWVTYVAGAAEVTGDDLKAFTTTSKVTDTSEIPSAAGGSGSGGEVYGVTFLDWDGTIIGTATVPKDSTESAGAISTLEQADAALKTALVGKTGYVFDCWLNAADPAVKSGKTFTSNNKALADDAQGVADLAKLADYAAKIGDEEGVVLQAAYKAKLAEGITPDEHTNYTDPTIYDASFALANSVVNANYTQDESKLYFIRYGNATQGEKGVGKYGIRIAYNRTNDSGVGVQRAIDPIVIVKMQPRGTSADNALASLYETVNGDTITTEIAPTRDIERLTVMLGERSGAPTWINSGTRSGSARSYNMLNVIRRGTANYILEQAVRELNQEAGGEWNTNVTAATFNDLTLTSLTAEGGMVTDGNLASYKEKIIAAGNVANTKLFDVAENVYSVKPSVTYETLCQELGLTALEDEV